MNTTIKFEIPTHPLSKTGLKIESLFHEIVIASQESHPIIHQRALFSCIEIINLTHKPELKSRYLKELIRIRYALAKSNIKIADEYYIKLVKHINFLSQRSGTFAAPLLNNPLLHAINSNQISGPNESYNPPPHLKLWLHVTNQERKECIKQWIETLTPLIDLNHTYLSLVRTCINENALHLQQGFYQCSLPSLSSCLLIVVNIEPQWNLIPKVQQGHKRFTLTLEPGFSNQRPFKFPESLSIGFAQI